MIKRWWFRFHKKRLEKKKLQFISWFHSKFPGKYCWVDCVAWSFNPRKFNPFRVDSAKACQTESETHDTLMCYCGGWQEGKCWDKLTAQEKENITNNEKVVQKLMDDLPF